MSYDVILADPPWWYNERSANRKSGGRGTKFGGGACSHYPLMRDTDLLAMAEFVKSLMEGDCALFMWATAPRLDFATSLLKAWGFRYATVGFTWVKTTKGGDVHNGPGSYTASNAEFCLLGIRGKKRPDRKLVPSVVLYPRLRHSEKPPVVRQRIEAMYPSARRIELFARHTAPGWDAWGNAVGVLDAKSGTLDLAAG